MKIEIAARGIDKQRIGLDVARSGQQRRAATISEAETPAGDMDIGTVYRTISIGYVVFPGGRAKILEYASAVGTVGAVDVIPADGIIDKARRETVNVDPATLLER